MKERHTLYHRPTLQSEPKKVKTFLTYKDAIIAGMKQCGHGKFWVDSERQQRKAWIEFAPPEPTLD